MDYLSNFENWTTAKLLWTYQLIKSVLDSMTVLYCLFLNVVKDFDFIRSQKPKPIFIYFFRVSSEERSFHKMLL